MINSTTTRTWSAQQQAIFEWFERGNDSYIGRHLIVRARAGTGKSTTIREGVKRAPEQNILIAAFSKNIQLDMERLIGQFAGQVKTLHAVGYACVRRFRDNIKVAFNSDRADALALQACGPTAPDAILRLVSKLHTKGREVAPHAYKLGDLTALAITFECEPDEQWAAAGFDLAYVEAKALQAMVLASQVKSGDTIDGSDMIFLPVRNDWLTKQFDMVVVDEAQDMTTAQLEIAQGVLKPGGRICIVGDDRQAIFGFRGADSGSLDRLKAELGAAELGLTTTYRCGKAIVALAQAYVPDFEAGADNPEGLVRSLGDCVDCGGVGRWKLSNEWSHTEDCPTCKGTGTTGETLVTAAGPGDFILSRVNAPLVSIAMKLLRAGKRTRVAGKDVGKGLTTLVRKLKARSVPDLLAKIEAWAQRENARHEAALKAATNGRATALKAKIEATLDQADMLASLAEGARSVTEVEGRIEALFTDDGLGQAGVITCSSVHRAKGLEADRVFVLKDTLRDNNQEEQNIAYVAITRAKRELVWATREQA